MSNSAAYYVGGLEVYFETNDILINNHLTWLLRYHKQKLNDTIYNEITVRIIVVRHLERNNYELIKINDGEYICNVSDSFSINKPQKFYYLVLMKIIIKIGKCYGQISAHGTMLYSDDIGYILLLGKSGGGKSTIAASWLNQGLPIMGDDMLFFYNNKSYVFRRELHIHESLLNKFKLKALELSQPYMQGYDKLGYDWITEYPELSITKGDLPQFILKSNVQPNHKSSVQLIVSNEEKELILQQANEYDDENDNLIDHNKNIQTKLLNAHYYYVTWSDDIWSYERNHFGFLYNMLKDNII